MNDGPPRIRLPRGPAGYFNPASASAFRCPGPEPAGGCRSLPDIARQVRRRIGLALALAGAAASLAGIAAPGAAARAVPWPETECIPASPGETRTSATCGATLVDGRAIPPPSAPPLVKAVIAAANPIDGRPY